MPTIKTSFDPTTLPRWAQKIPAVLHLAERDLAFRCDVLRCTTPQYRWFLISEASRFQQMCAGCGERPGTHQQTGVDTGGDTDERIYYSRWVCNECDPAWEGAA